MRLNETQIPKLLNRNKSKCETDLLERITVCLRLRYASTLHLILRNENQTLRN
jgi:hypothetical protein